MFSESFEECHILEKTSNLCNRSKRNDVILTINVQKFRSRYDKYLYYNCTRVVCDCHGNKRGREPSRIPVKKLHHLYAKNRNLQCYVFYRTHKNIPKSSKVHRIISSIKARMKPKKRLNKQNYKNFVQTMKGKVHITNHRYIPHYYDRLKKHFAWFRLFSSNYFVYNEYKNTNHKRNFTRCKLCNDIEKNPGPALHYIDPSETINAPYSQGSIAVFGDNAGQQCIAMSICSLIYHHIKAINTSNDLIIIMHIGNELYTSLSQLARQSFLLLTELTTMLTLLEDNFQLDYSESYTGYVHGDSVINGFEYCMGLQRAFETIISQQYSSFILIIGAIGVAVIHNPITGMFKVFDSHARDIYGNSHPLGTCVLLHASSINHLVQYFQSLYGQMDIYELKGIKITQLPMQNIQNNDIRNASELTKSFGISFSICFYAICYSIISPCCYWNQNTLNAIKCNASSLNSILPSVIPASVDICGSNIQIHSNNQTSERIECILIEIKEILTMKISRNCQQSTGFLIWTSTSSIACTNQQNLQKNDFFLMCQLAMILL